MIQNEAESWFNANHLLLSEDKTQTIIFTTAKGEQNQIATFLGIQIDSHLTWHNHCDNLCKQLAKALFAIRRIKAVINQDAAKIAYFSLFHSKMTYGVLIWGHSASMQHVFRLQKKAIRIIEGASDMESCVPLFTKHNVMTLPSAYIYAQLVTIKESVASCPTRGDLRGRCLRNDDDLHIEQHRLHTTQPLRVGKKLYNGLPEELKSLNIKNFKIKIKQYLIKKCYYGVSEYFN